MKYEHKSKLEDCIYVEDNAISKMLCYDLIKHFEDSISFRTDDHRKQADEMQLVGDPRKESIEFKDKLLDVIYSIGVRCENNLHYLCGDDRPYDAPMTTMYNTVFRSLQIQRYTAEDSGYPAVHIESGPKHHKKYLAVILYLNDCDDGETVFPVAGAEIQPEMGRIAIWPAGLPFYHYGKKSSTVKYIITTWFEFE